MPSFQDRNLTCSDCQQTFVFTSGEQAFHAEKGFSNDPKRCPDCRSKKKAQSKPRGGGAGRSFGGPRRETQKFPAVCSRCNANFDAPFQPKPDRPVLCRDCFQSSKGSSFR